MLANMASSLIIHKRIKTTLAKAKALRVYVEPLINRSKDDSTHSRRMVFRYLQNKEAVSELFREVSMKVADRPGGYTRILKLGSRMGDNAEMCMIELVDFNDNLVTESKTKAKTTRRGRRGGAKKTEGDAPEVAAAVATEVAEAPEVEVAEEVTEEPTSAEATVDEPVAEVKEEVEAEVKEEPAKAEAPAEEPKAEVKEEPKAEAAPAEEKPAEEPKAEVKEEPASAEAPAEEPKAEVKEEPKAEATPEEKPAEEEKKDDEEKKAE